MESRRDHSRRKKGSNHPLARFFNHAESKVVVLLQIEVGQNARTVGYLTAGWSLRVIVERRWRHWPAMLFATWWSVDGSYALYWSLVDPVPLQMMRDANWPASLSLNWICGLIWYWNGTLYELRLALRRGLPNLRP